MHHQRPRTSTYTAPQFSHGTSEERSRHADIKLANPHVAEHAAALAVHELASEMTYAEAWWLAHKAASWAAQAHYKWFWRGIPGNGYGLGCRANAWRQA
jgi:hypothetical protein